MARNVSLQDMRIFLAVYDQRGVGAAALSLGMSQSGLSSALAKLRRQLGDDLFVSTSTGMQPTTRAKELAGPIREAVQCIEQRVLNKATFDPASDEREFRIALSDTAEAMYLPRALAVLTRIAPQVRLRTVAMPQAQLQRSLSEGQLDLALGYFPDLQSAEFVRRKIGQHGFVCICSSANRHVIQDFSLKKYCEARHAVVAAPTRTQGLLESYVQKRGIVRKVALTTPHFMSLPEIIASTELIATVPDAIADAFAENRRLARLELPFRSPVFEAHVHWSKSVSNDPGHRWLRGVIFDASVGKAR
jgi:DNA-binding transcriptional LysR family regulator